jgi:hypothetical protein
MTGWLSRDGTGTFCGGSGCPPKRAALTIDRYSFTGVIAGEPALMRGSSIGLEARVTSPG